MLQEFIAGLKNDNLSSPNRYLVYITGSGNVGSLTYETMLNCAATSIPSLNIVTTQDKRVGIGNMQQFPDGRDLTPITLTFYESESFKERKYFSQWIDAIYNKDTKRFGFFKDYAKTVQIDQLGKDNRVLYTCILYDAFPNHVSEMNRSYSHIDTYEQFSVSIVYNEMLELFYDATGNLINV